MSLEGESLAVVSRLLTARGMGGRLSGPQFCFRLSMALKQFFGNAPLICTKYL